MPYTNGVFKRLRSWVADKAAGLGMLPELMDQDADDIALGLSTAWLRDGTSSPTADITMAGKKLIFLGAPANAGDALSLGNTPASEVTRALGYLPVKGDGVGGHQITISYDGTGLTAAVDGNAGFGRVWTANTLGAAQLNGIAGQVLYGTNNLNGGQIGAILGYTPSRNSTVIAADGGTTGNIANGGNSVIGSANFTATGANLLVLTELALVSTIAGTRCTVFTNIIDNTTGAGAGNTPSTIIDVPLAGAYCPVTTIAELACTIGHNYTIIFYAGQNGGSGATYVGYWHIGGLNG